MSCGTQGLYCEMAGRSSPTHVTDESTSQRSPCVPHRDRGAEPGRRGVTLARMFWDIAQLGELADGGHLAPSACTRLPTRPMSRDGGGPRQGDLGPRRQVFDGNADPPRVAAAASRPRTLTCEEGCPAARNRVCPSPADRAARSRHVHPRRCRQTAAALSCAGLAGTMPYGNEHFHISK